MSAEATKHFPAFEDSSKPVREGEELDLAHLEPYLRSHFPDLGGTLAIKQFPSGHSNLTYSISLNEKEMVLRRPPFGSKVKSAHDMGREYHVLEKLHAAYPTPQPLLYCTDESVLGAPFYVMERVRGVILRRNLPTSLSVARLRRAVTELARLEAMGELREGANGEGAKSLVMRLGRAVDELEILLREVQAPA